MLKKGFTLLELLVLMAIIGMLSSVLVSNTQVGINKARGSNIILNLREVDKAFTLKALRDNIDTWWHEDDFPEESSWATYISDLTEGSISEFLPIAPEVPGAESYDYAYDNDGNDTFALPCDATSLNSSATANQFHRTVTGGVNIVVAPDAHYSSERFQGIFASMDNTFDDGDGPLCGRVRTHGFDNNPYLEGRNNKKHNIRFIIDEDQYPDF